MRIWFMLCLYVVTGLGCHCPIPWTADASPTLPQKVDGADDSTIVNMKKQFKSEKVQLITEGEDYLISIPASVLFGNQSPHLTWESYAILNDVACYLRQFRKIAVHVTAYSSRYVSAQREHALTLARARTVAEYLWSQGIDSRLIFTQGLGSDKPIVLPSSHRGDRSANARIEVTFRRAVV